MDGLDNVHLKDCRNDANGRRPPTAGGGLVYAYRTGQVDFRTIWPRCARERYSPWLCVYQKAALRWLEPLKDPRTSPKHLRRAGTASVRVSHGDDRPQGSLNRNTLTERVSRRRREGIFPPRAAT